ncbi:MAG: tetratricopeptide repeat protein, partial [Bradymonadaceae bacterium]
MDPQDQQAQIDTLLNQLLDRLPATSDSVLTLVRDVEAHGFVEVAFSVLRRAAAVAPGGLLSKEYALRCYHAGEVRDALLHMETYIKESPEDGEAWVFLARIHSALENIDQVHYCLDAASKRDVPRHHIILWEERLLTPSSDDIDATKQRTIPAPQRPSSQPLSRESTHSIYRPAAPYDSGLILSTLRAVLDDAPRGGTEPFRVALSQDQTMEDALILESGPELQLEVEPLTFEQSIPIPAPEPTVDEATEEQQVPRSASVFSTGSIPRAPQPQPTAPPGVPTNMPPPGPPDGPSDFPPTGPTVPPLMPPGQDQPAHAIRQADQESRSGGTLVHQKEGGKGKKIAIAAVLSLLIAGLGGWFGAGHIQHQRLGELMVEVHQSRVVDTYAGHVEALAMVEAAEETTRILPPALDGFVFGVLPAFPGKDVKSLRRQARLEEVELAALIEWRFESEGSRNALEHLEKAPPNHPQVRAASVYLSLLSGAEEEALTIARESYDAHPKSVAVQEALAEALIALDSDDEVEGLSNVLEEEAQPSPRRRFLALRLEQSEQGREDDVAALKAFLKEYGAPYFDGRLQLVQLVDNDDPEYEELSEWLRDITGDSSKEVLATYQRARAFHVLGRLSLRAGDTETARESLGQAIEVAPMRTGLYPALIDLEIEEARFEEALTILETMEQNVGQGSRTGVLERRADIALRTGAPRDALTSLREISSPTYRSNWLLGLVHLELGAADAARRAFEASSQKKGTPWAKAFTLYTRAAKNGDEDKKKTLEQLEELCNAYEDNPMVLRACALSAAHEADVDPSRTQRQSSLEEAQTHLLAALEIKPSDPFLMYDLCTVEIA